METFTSSSRSGMITIFIFPGDCARLITVVPAVHWLLATVFRYRRVLVALTPLLGARKCKGPLMLLLSYLGRRVNVSLVNHFSLFASWLALVCWVPELSWQAEGLWIINHPYFQIYKSWSQQRQKKRSSNLLLTLPAQRMLSVLIWSHHKSWFVPVPVPSPRERPPYF